MTYKVIDDFLDKTDFYPLYDYLNADNTAWFYKGQGTVKDKPFDISWFSHTFYANQQPDVSSYHQLIPNILTKLEAKSVMRVQANLVLKQDKAIKTGFHQDVPYAESKTAILYINTNDGCTIVVDEKGNEKKIKSVENRILIFPSNTDHASITQTNSEKRIVVNFNYF
jgi:hypothetical protein